MRVGLTISGLALACLPVLTPHPARADACDTLMAAMVAQSKVPYAATTTTTLPGQPVTHGEVVATSDTMYIKVMGTWQSMKFNAQESIKQAQEKAKTAKRTCQLVGADTVNGVSATLYADHAENRGTSIESRIWIADGSGLPAQVEFRFGNNGGSELMQYRYDNIQAPVGAK
jgi:hypothetical protein